MDTLHSLAGQTLPAGCFNVLVVDDGSVDGTAGVQQEPFPFALHYLYQSNQGDAQARNVAAEWSTADILVFLDDDMVVAAEYLSTLLEALIGRPRRIVVGVERLWLRADNPLQALPRREQQFEGDPAPIAIEFTTIRSNNMALWRSAYREVGPMDSFGFSGSSMWCDVDFAYRAFQLGYDFYSCPQAICWHRDYVHQNLTSQKKRMEEAGYRAVALFQRHPQLIGYVPMFDDKTPVAWGADSPGAVMRKAARRLVDLPPLLWSLESTSSMIEQNRPSSRLLIPLRRWLVGSYIYRGYRRGLREVGEANR